VLAEFRWVLIELGWYHKCHRCNGSVRHREVAEWAFKNQVRWFCPDCFKIMKDRAKSRKKRDYDYVSDDDIEYATYKRYIRSFTRMVDKKCPK